MKDFLQSFKMFLFCAIPWGQRTRAFLKSRRVGGKGKKIPLKSATFKPKQKPNDEIKISAFQKLFFNFCYAMYKDTVLKNIF